MSAAVFALGGSVAGADPPPWAHGHGHGGGPPGQDGGPPAPAHSSGPPAPPPPVPPPVVPAPQQADGGQGPGDNPGHGGTPPGHGGEPRGHQHQHGNRSSGNGSPSPAPTPTPAPAPTVTPTPTQAPNTPAVTTPITAPPVATPTQPTPTTNTGTPASPGPLPGISITSLALHGTGSKARGGALAAAVAAARSAFSANPLTTPLAPATAGVAGPAANGSGTNPTTFTHPGQRVRTIVVPPSSSPATVIARFISKIPTGVWIALAVAIGLAAIGGGAAVAAGRRARRRAGEVAAVTADAITDPLTGVLNRRGFTQSAERELERARRYGHPLALAYVDVRGLKAVNDSEGHPAGDRLLGEVALMLGQSARTHDLVGRMGGDELAVLLAEQAEPGAEALARRVRDQVPAHRAALGLSTPWDVTIGTASFPGDGDTLDDLIAAADRRMYEQRGIELQRH